MSSNPKSQGNAPSTLKLPPRILTMPLKHPVDCLSREIWERIAFYAVASEETFLGPPAVICSLSLLSRNVYDQISFKNNTHLYARIFRFKFDSSAPARRLSERWRTTKCLASELIKRLRAMKRIRTMDLEVDDVWTAYLMLLENDGKNEAQLVQYAGFKGYLKALIVYRTTSHDLTWFKSPTLDSLVIWLLWETSERESIRREGLGSTFRECLLGLLHSFIITGYRHSSTYGPDICFNLPLCSELSPEDITSWRSPPTSEIVHYSHRLRLVSPVVAPAAVLSLVVQADSFQDSTNIPESTHDLPLNRDDAMAQGRVGPTVADILDFHLNTRPPTVPRCKLVIDTHFIEDLEMIEEVSDEGTREGSIRRDEDWYRLVSCHDPRIGDMPLRGSVYKPGILAGRWAGRLLVTDIELYTSLLNRQSNPSTVSIRHSPLYWELQEHHCLSPNIPLPPGVDDRWGDDILNAWLPQGAILTHVEDALEAYDPNTGHTARYETVIPGNAALYSSTSASEKLSKSWISDPSDEEIAGEGTQDSASGSSNQEIGLGSTSTIDDDDEYCDTASHRSSGISDILITGKTGEHFGEAWGHFTIYGRVRPWDGLVVLLRVPSNPFHQHLGRWIFKGYIHDQNFAGRWRETSTPLDLIGYEGGFVVYKTGAAGNP